MRSDLTKLGNSGCLFVRRIAGLAFVIAFPLSLVAGGDGLCAGRPYAVGRICDVQDFESCANLKRAFEFLRTADLSSIRDGRIEIDGDNVFANASTADLVPIDREGDFEAHRQYIDIHVPLTEEETLGTFVLTERELNLPFNAKDDYVLYKAKGGSVTVKPGEFAVFFPPYGGHRPGCTSQKEPLKGHRKLCVKVKASGPASGIRRADNTPDFDIKTNCRKRNTNQQNKEAIK